MEVVSSLVPLYENYTSWGHSEITIEMSFVQTRSGVACVINHGHVTNITLKL